MAQSSPHSRKLSVGIVGATGYTGVELLRLLAGHPDVSIQVITSRGEKGLPVAELYPSLRGHIDLAFVEPDIDQLGECDIVFFATPHGVAQATIPDLMKRKARIVDLSADFRLKDIALWEKWYGQKHAAPALAGAAVYGLPEIYRSAIASAKLVAAAGCYPTSVQLGFLPLLEAGWVETNNLVANSASGVSGAGRQAKIDNLFSEMGESFKAYGASGHRHLPEIEQGLRQMAGRDVRLTFVPHLLPMVRGIHSTLYASVNQAGAARTEKDIQQLFETRYQHEPFVDVLPLGALPQTRTVKGSNRCQLSVLRPQQRDVIVVLAVIDNLTKGASGQAIQCMNIMCGLPETAG
ncbi:MAG TPA: N-acetyl-gamma-glutamyl-phosphate reductase, partial [Verrucomicrobiae bacterium]